MNRQMEASPQLDAVVAEQFLGEGERPTWFEAPPPYSSDIAVAFRLMTSERWPPGWALRKRPPQRWQVLDLEDGLTVVAEASTSALAICRAALLALRGAERPDVVREPLSNPRCPLPEDLVWIYSNVPACYRIQRWLNRSGRTWWRGSFGPAADLDAIGRELRMAGFPYVHPASGNPPTDLYLRRCSPVEANWIG